MTAVNILTQIDIILAAIIIDKSNSGMCCFIVLVIFALKLHVDVKNMSSKFCLFV